MTVWIAIECSHESSTGKQRYHCQNTGFPYRTFVLTQTYLGRTREVKQQIVEMTLNGSGVRDIARVLHFKKLSFLKQVNQKLLQRLNPESVEMEIIRVEDRAMVDR